MIVEALGRGRNAVAVWQDLVPQHGFAARYASVGRFVHQLRGMPTSEAHPVIVTPRRGSAGRLRRRAMVRDPQTGKYRRARLIVLTLGASCKAVWSSRPSGQAQSGSTGTALNFGWTATPPTCHIVLVNVRPTTTPLEGASMRNVHSALLILAATLATTTPVGAQGAKPLTKCASDAVVSGTVCMDAYEVSVWRVPDPTGANSTVVKHIRSGRATINELSLAGASALGMGFDDFAPCADSGQNCLDDIYAVSVPGAIPSAHVTWFQAQAACDNSGKRLPTNAEWQAAVIGTPDPGPDNGTTDCNSTSQVGQDPTLTGSRSACRSNRGAYDMVGNVSEWVADWVPRGTACDAWSSSLATGDTQCFLGAAPTGEPAALIRGGNYVSSSSTLAGPLAVDSSAPLSSAINRIGFRCAR